MLTRRGLRLINRPRGGALLEALFEVALAVALGAALAAIETVRGQRRPR